MCRIFLLLLVRLLLFCFFLLSALLNSCGSFSSNSNNSYISNNESPGVCVYKIKKIAKARRKMFVVFCLPDFSKHISFIFLSL